MEEGWGDTRARGTPIVAGCDPLEKNAWKKIRSYAKDTAGISLFFLVKEKESE